MDLGTVKNDAGRHDAAFPDDFFYRYSPRATWDNNEMGGRMMDHFHRSNFDPNSSPAFANCCKSDSLRLVSAVCSLFNEIQPKKFMLLMLSAYSRLSHQID
jgi:hypothetical protein